MAARLVPYYEDEKTTGVGLVAGAVSVSRYELEQKQSAPVSSRLSGLVLLGIQLKGLLHDQTNGCITPGYFAPDGPALEVGHERLEQLGRGGPQP